MADESEPRESEKRPVSHTVLGLSVLFAMLVCYVLSPVPVIWGLDRLGIYDRFQTAFETFYAPLISMIDNVEFVSDFYGWQAKLFDL